MTQHCRVFSLFFAVLLAFPVPFADAEDAASWNQWRGPNRDAKLLEYVWPVALKDKLELVWEHPHSPSYSGPIVHDGLVFTTETINKEIERVTAYQLANGEKVWSTQWAGAMEVPFFAASNGSWIRATPVVVPGHLLVVGIKDVLVCLDPKTGDEKWRVDFPGDMGGPVPAFGAASSPIVDGDGVIMQSGGAVVRLRLSDGSLVWKTLESGSDMMSSGAFSSPTIATLCGVRQLVVQTRTELCGVDLSTGQVMWREKIEAFRGMNILTPLVIGDKIYTSAHSGKAQLFEIALSGDSAWSVKEIWDQKTQAYMSSPVVIGDTILLHAKNQRVISTSISDGDIRWTSPPQAKYWSMVANGTKVLALSDDGDLLLMDGSAEKFEIVDRKKVAEDSWAHLGVEGQYVLIRDLKSLKVFRWKD